MNNIMRVVALAGMGIFGLRGILPALTTAQFGVILVMLFGMGMALCLAVSPKGCPLGELARRKGWLADVHVNQILQRQKSGGGMFGEIALREHLLSEGQLRELLSTQSSRVRAA